MFDWQSSSSRSEWTFHEGNDLGGSGGRTVPPVTRLTRGLSLSWVQASPRSSCPPSPQTQAAPGSSVWPLYTRAHTHVCTCTHIHFTTAWASRVFHLPLAAMWGNSFPKMPQPRRAGRLGNSQESWPPGSGGCVSTNQRCQRLVLGAPGVGQFAHRGVSKQKEISCPRPPRTLSPKLHQQEELCFHLRFPAQQTSLSQPR